MTGDLFKGSQSPTLQLTGDAYLGGLLLLGYIDYIAHGENIVMAFQLEGRLDFYAIRREELWH